jgi:predicted CxxxxCH...CXXCH cytochrome family protein
MGREFGWKSETSDLNDNHWAGWLLITLLTLGFGGCGADPLCDGVPDAIPSVSTCSRCHGSLANSAPPLAIDGSIQTSSRGVGAHQAHLLGGNLRAPIKCSECHVVPGMVTEEGHIDTLPAELTWGPLATSAGAEPEWSLVTSTCASNYCHGATLTGGSNTEPIWTVVDGSQDACGTCHGAPPPAPHPNVHECQMCHPDTVTADGQIDLVSGKHINGTIDVTGGGGGCSACHGSEDNAAPPKSLNGATDTGTVEVGAHQAHLSGGSLRTAMSCEDCHIVPTAMDSESHYGEAPAEVTWGGLATTGGLEPGWDRDVASCASTYCHGATLTGGSNTAPTWTTVDGSQDACGSCHGSPPPAPHPQNEQCNVCHPNTVTADQEIDVAGGYHIDGKVDGPGASCSACHGSPDSPAPPKGVDGETETIEIAVGAHQIHLSGGLVRKGINCAECHVIPGNVGDPAHMDAAPAEIVFGELASGDGEPSWKHASASCSSTYCHGATLTGGEVEIPIWTIVDGSQSQCSSCHGNPPPAPHPQNENSNMCHPDTVMPDGTIDLEARRHIDGEVTVIGGTCSVCHGSEDNAAPPLSLSGEEDTTVTEVGAHQSHLADGAYRAAMSCDDCHVVPDTMGAAGHLDEAPAELTWGILATAAGAAGDWDRENTTCNSTYCHGATLSGGSNTAPDWTVVDGTEVGCGSCHGFPPPLPHTPSMACSNCHGDTVDASGTIDIAGGMHINGEVEVGAGACNACHGNADGPAPPFSVTGESDTKFTEVGAHQAHVTDGPLKSEMWCTECHVVPSSVGDASHMDASPAEINWGDLALVGGVAADWNRDSNTCSSTYCHGATLAGGSNTAPVWTTVDGSQSACGTCHGWPPPLPHPQSDQCFLCHPDTVGENGNILLPNDKHIDGELQVQLGGCNSCHGNEDNAAPPTSMSGSSDTADVEVGAHQAHLMGGEFKTAMACANCHVVPDNASAEGHLDASPAEVMWDELANAGGTDPAWDHDAATCSSTYCHGATLAGGTNTNPVWTEVGNGQVTCGSCHGNPPPLPHPQVTDCSFCHQETVAADGSIILADDRHIDGTLQVQYGACNSCHGNEDNAAPPTAMSGSSDTNDVEVGAHQAHLKDGEFRQAMTCGDCHVVPANAGDEGHLDASPAEIIWGELALSNDSQPEWGHDAETCSSVYCHGSTLDGGTVPEPVWTDVDTDQIGCGSCHGKPPVENHPNMYDCHSCHYDMGTNCLTCHVGMAGPSISFDEAPDHCHLCHGDTVLEDGQIDVPGGQHIDGKVQFTFGGTCGACHALPPDTGTHKIHFSAPTDAISYNGTEGTAETNPGGNGYGFNCGNCHPSGGGSHGNGVFNAGGGDAEIDLSPAGAPPGSLKSLNSPLAEYIPGEEVLVDANGMKYTLGTCNNIYCHSSKTYESGPVPAPDTDFPFDNIYPISYPEYEVVEKRIYEPATWGGQIACDGCHGFPPRTTSENAQAGVGQSHSWIDDQGYDNMHAWNHGYGPIGCAACHAGTVTDLGETYYAGPGEGVAFYEPIPITNFENHVNGVGNVAFTTEPVKVKGYHDLTTAAYNPETRSCNSVSCHIFEETVKWGAPYRWWNSSECNKCHQY